MSMLPIATLEKLSGKNFWTFFIKFLWTKFANFSWKFKVEEKRGITKMFLTDNETLKHRVCWSKFILEL